MTKLNGVKNVIMEVTYFLNDPMFNLLRYCHIIYYERKWLLMTNLATILPKSKLCWKFQRFNAIDGSIKMLINNSQKFQLKWKIVKHFTRPKQLATWRKLLILPPPYPPSDKILLRLWNKNFLTEISRNIQTFLFKVLPPHHEILPAALLQTNLYKKSIDCQNYLRTKSTHLFSLLKKVFLVVKHRGIQKTFPRSNKKIFWTWLQWIDCKKTN